jgi:hypothetical protein
MVPTGATADHVIPRAHGGGSITIPSCRGCNREKGSKSLPEFLASPYFAKIRESKHKNQWSLRDLWLALGLAAVEQARANANTWPGTGQPIKAAAKQSAKANGAVSPTTGD